MKINTKNKYVEAKLQGIGAKLVIMEEGKSNEDDKQFSTISKSHSMKKTHIDVIQVPALGIDAHETGMTKKFGNNTMLLTDPIDSYGATLNQKNTSRRVIEDATTPQIQRVLEPNTAYRTQESGYHQTDILIKKRDGNDDEEHDVNMGVQEDEDDEDDENDEV